MYSIVMMAALTAAPETPEFFKKNQGGCYGCAGYGDPYGYGCAGYGHGNKFCGGGFLGLGLCGKKGGYGYGDPYGYGCAGYGQGGGKFCGLCGGGFLGFGLLGKKGGHGYGCAGYGYGVPAAPAGNAYAPMGYGHEMAHGYGYGPPMGYGYAPPMPAYGPPMGGYGGMHMAYGYAPAQPAAIPAQVVVKVPADAKVFANGHLTDLAGTERVFATPEITAGKDYRYVIEVEKNGVKSSKEIVVRAGHQTVVDFSERAASTVTVSLPEKARLTVDGVTAPAASGKSTFLTPELTKGQPYSYSFQVEVEKEGRVEVVTQKVRFVAGEPVNLDFTDVATASAK